MSGAAITIGDAILRILGDDSGLDPSLASAENKAKSWAGRLEGGISKLVGGAIVGGVAALTGAVVGVGAAAFAAGGQFDDAYDKIQVRTGATGSTLAQLQKDFKATFTSVPTDAGTASDAIAALNSRLGITGDGLTGIAKPLLEATRLMGGDAKTNADLFTRAMGDWNIAVDKAPATLDKFFVASQKGGVGMDNLMAKVVQFGSPMRLMGFTLEDSIALFAKWEKEGVNSELVMGSLRIAAGKFANEGKPLRESLLATFDSIQKNTDASAALADGMAIFGARAGPDMVAAIREGRFSIDDLVAAMGNSKGAILDAAAATVDFPEKLNVMKNKAIAAIAPLGLTMMGIVTTVVDRLGPAFDNLAPVFEKVASYVDRFWNSFQVGMENGGSLLDGLANALYSLDDISPIFDTLGDAVYTAGDFIGNTLMPALQSLGQWIYDNRETILSVIAGVTAGLATFSIISSVVGWITAFVAAIGGIVSGVSAAGGGLAGLVALLGGPVTLAIVAVAAIVALLAAAWVGNWGDIQGVTASVVGFLRNLIGQFLAAVQAWWKQHGDAVMAVASGLWNGIVDVVQTVIGILVSAISSALSAIKGFWDAHGEQIIAVARSAWDLIKGIIQGVLDAIGFIFEAFALAFQGDWTGFGEKLRQAWDTLWETMKTTVSTAWDGIKTAVKVLIESTIRFFKETDWGEVGRNIVRGIANGITSAVDWIVRAVQGMGAAAIAAIRGFLGIKSPSRKFAVEVGRPMAMGVAVGFEEMMSTARERMQASLGGLALNLATAPGLTGSGGRVTNNQFTQNIHTNAPSEPIVSDFGRLRARARG